MQVISAHQTKRTVSPLLMLKEKQKSNFHTKKSWLIKRPSIVRLDLTMTYEVPRIFTGTGKGTSFMRKHET